MRELETAALAEARAKSVQKQDVDWFTWKVSDSKKMKIGVCEADGLVHYMVEDDKGKIKHVTALFLLCEMTGY